jgi:hypothetical protein
MNTHETKAVDDEKVRIIDIFHPCREEYIPMK